VPRRPLFVLDENFPEPVLRAALSQWAPEIDLRPLKNVEPRLLGDQEDWRVILGAKQAGAEGLVTCDDSMLHLPEVIAVIEQTAFTVISCQETGHDGIVASGLLIAHIPRIARRHDPHRPQVWQLSAPERQPRRIGDLKEEIRRRSGRDVDAYKLSQQMLESPLFP